MEVTVWSKDNCPFCEKAKNLLKLKGVEFEERKIGHGWTREDLLAVAPNSRSVPQIFWGSECIGGFDELHRRIG
jgi:glutaredoxin 3